MPILSPINPTFLQNRNDLIYKIDNAVGAVLSQILLEFECGHRPDIIMLRAPQTAETR
jgi:hypothetical protein